MIPKIIHQIWIGPKKRPVEWMDTWKEKNPSFEYVLWNEEKIEKSGLLLMDSYRELIGVGEYPGACDLARVSLLCEYGGVYIDADAVCVRSIEDAPFMDKKFFAVLDHDDRKGRYKNIVANGILGSMKWHPIMKSYLAKICNAEVDGRKWEKLGWRTLTKCVDDYGRDKDDISILPTYSFLPVNYDGRKAEKININYSDHKWGRTKGLYV